MKNLWERSLALSLRAWYLLFVGMWRGEIGFTLYDAKGACAEFSSVFHSDALRELIQERKIDPNKFKNLKCWWKRSN